MGFLEKHKWFKGNVYLSIEKAEVLLGDELKGLVSLRGDGEFNVEKIWVTLRCREHVAVWSEENGDDWDMATLDSYEVQVVGSVHVTGGFYREFPFVINLPLGGRETYHSIYRNVQWILHGHIKIKEHKQSIAVEGGGEITIIKPTASVKEVVREVIMMPCVCCGGLMTQTSVFCPNCGAKRNPK